MRYVSTILFFVLFLCSPCCSLLYCFRFRFWASTTYRVVVVAALFTIQITSSNFSINEARRFESWESGCQVCGLLYRESVHPPLRTTAFVRTPYFCQFSLFFCCLSVCCPSLCCVLSGATSAQSRQSSSMSRGLWWWLLSGLLLCLSPSVCVSLVALSSSGVCALYLLTYICTLYMSV